MQPSPGEMLRLWFEEVWNQRDASRIAHYLAPNGVLHSLDMAGQDAQGPAAFRAFQEELLQCFPDIQFTLHDVIEDGERAAGRWTMEATHSGDGLGMSATGERVRISGMSMVRASGGTIVEAWDEWDRIRLVTTCGMMKPV